MAEQKASASGREDVSRHRSRGGRELRRLAILPAMASGSVRIGSFGVRASRAASPSGVSQRRGLRGRRYYEAVAGLDGGFSIWKQADLPIDDHHSDI